MFRRPAAITHGLRRVLPEIFLCLAAGMAAGGLRPIDPRFLFPPAGILLVLWFAGHRLRITWAARPSGALSLFLTGALLMSLSLQPPPGGPSEYTGRPCRLEGRVEGLPRGFKGGVSARLDLRRIQDGSQTGSAAGRIRMWFYGLEEGLLEPGDLVRAEAVPGRPLGKRFPGDRDRRVALAGEGVYATAGVEAGPRLMVIKGKPALWWRPVLEYRRRTSALLKTLGQPGDGLLHALLLGRRDRLEDKLRESIRMAGLAHILAVSGLHIGLVGVIAFSVSLFILRRVHPLAARLDVRRPAALAAIIPVAAYTAVTGAHPPAVRACIMAGIFFLGVAAERSADHTGSLALAGLIILVLSPPALFSPSFQLSFAAVFTIIKVVEGLPGLFSTAVEDGRRRVGMIFLRFFVISAAALLGTFPLAGYHFSLFTPCGALAGLVAIPLCALSILPFGLAAGLIAPLNMTLARWVVAPADWGCRVMAVLSGRVASAEFLRLEGFHLSPAQTAALYMMILSLLYLRKRPGRLLLPLAGVILFSVSVTAVSRDGRDTAVRATFLDVGQGDAALLEVPGKGCWLVDSGGRFGSYDRGRSVVAPFLRARRIGELEALVISHGHPDHAGGAISALEGVDCREIWYGGMDHGGFVRGIRAAVPEVKIREISGGRRLDTSAGTFFFLSPAAGVEPGREPPIPEDVNDRSLVFVFRGRGASLIFTGDAGGEVLDNLADQEGMVMRADILKVPHHGSRGSCSKAFYEAVGPELAVIPAGNNPFGHPHREVTTGLEEAEVRVLVTGRDGTVVCSYRGGKWQTRLWNGEKFHVSPEGFWHWFMVGF